MALTDYEMDRQLVELTGVRCVYPGHPLVIAFTIMSTFDSLSEANTKKAGSSFKAALVSQSVPGAGSHVHKALDLLKKVEQGLMQVGDFPKQADVEWKRATNNAYMSAQAAGLAQAQVLMPMFLEKAQQWFIRATELEQHELVQ